MLKKMNILKNKKVALEAHIDHSYFVSKNILIAQGWVRPEPNSEVKITLHANAGEVKVKPLKTINFKRPDVNKHFNDLDEVKSGVVCIFDIKDEYQRDTVNINVERDSTEKKLNLNVTGDVKNVLNPLALMDKAEFEVADLFLLKKYSSLIISASDGARVDPNGFPGCLQINVEHAFSIPNHGIFIQGWLVDAEKNLAGIHIKQGGVVSMNLLDSSTSFLRPDVNQVFSQYISDRYEAGLYGIALSDEFVSGLNYELIMVTKTGEISTQTLEVVAKPDDPVALIQSALTPFDLNRDGYQKELHGFIGDAITHIWKNKTLPAGEDEVEQYGKPVKAPDCSMIIPIYGRYDFVLYQMTQFDNDPYMQKVEIIYVLDDPKILSEFNSYCARVSPLLNLGFKTVYGGCNRGFAGANNLGVKHATAETLLLLNSDVMPKYNNWLADLISVFNKKKNVGVLGARLLFEDETIQHDGLEYQKLPSFEELWLIDHPGKGLPEWMARDCGVYEIPSVTGACMLIKKKTYETLGGFDESYILGDFEDSDLCLKALQSGLKNYIDTNTSLYHLERQSQNLFNDTSWKFKLTIFNGIQHSKRWDSTIIKLLEQGSK